MLLSDILVQILRTQPLRQWLIFHTEYYLLSMLKLQKSGTARPGTNKKKPRGFDPAGLPKSGADLLSHIAAVPSARKGLTSLFGMDRGGSPSL